MKNIYLYLKLVFVQFMLWMDGQVEVFYGRGYTFKRFQAQNLQRSTK